jgi:putative tryptophan/tyrosine transport system substrate-binding protein
MSASWVPEVSGGRSNDAIDPKPTSLHRSKADKMLRALDRSRPPNPSMCLIGGNAVKMGLAETLSHPGGNVTGVEMLLNDAEIKRLEIMNEIVPAAELVAYIQNPNTRPADGAAAEQTAALESAARRLGKKLLVLNAANDSELDQAFATIDRENPGGLIVGADGFFFMRVNRIVEQAAARRIPAIYFLREYVQSGRPRELWDEAR